LFVFSLIPLALALFLPVSQLFAVDWLPVDAATRGLQAPKIEADADAEILYWDFRVSDVFQGNDYWSRRENYLRIKIFTDKGIKEYSQVELPRGPQTTISDISARTIKPDGTIVELKKEDTVEREVLKLGRRKYRARVLNFPGVEKGSIIEYRFSEVRMRELSTNLRISFQREIPIHKLKISVKPLSSDYTLYRMRSYSFNTRIPEMKADAQGFSTFTLEDRKSFRLEPSMLPEYESKEWMLVFYEEDKRLTPDKFWKEVGKDDYKEFRQGLKVDGAMKQAAAEATKDATTGKEKAAAIDRWVRANVRNVYSLASGVTAEQRQQFKENKTPSDTLKQKLGTGYDLTMLFSSLAMAAGLEPRLTKSSDRSFRFFDPNYMARAMAPVRNIAIETEEGWQFFDPATAHLVPGMLAWREEGIRTLITDPKEPKLVDAPFLKPEQSQAKRSANVTIETDGAVTAKVVLSYTGHHARDRRLEIDEDTEAERIENETQELKQRYGGEVTDLKIENVNDDYQPLIYRFTVRIPGYATRTGKRLFVQPGFFQFQQPARFPESKRRHAMFFDYAWSELDEVTLTLPEGMALDQPTAPGGFGLGEIGEYKVELRKSQDSRALVYRRELIFGREGKIGFPVEAYPQLKKAFDAIHETDGHTITLRAEN
jgi:hypothetical protein